MKQFSIICAIAANGVIGGENKLLWHISEDLKRFKKITSGNPVIMGRKTFESLPFKPLPKRRNIIITRDPNFVYDGCEVVHSLDEAIKIAETDKENFVIGGGEIYKAFLPKVSKMYLTYVDKEFKGDTSFPEFDKNEWSIVNKEDVESKENQLGYSFVDYVRK